MFRILIADDHPIVRKGLKQILDEYEDVTVSAEASTGKEAIDILMKGGFDIVLLDVSMPGMSGLDVVRAMKRLNLHVPVLMLSMHPEEEFAVAALKAGASGYLTKGSPPEELISAVRKVCKGGRYISPAVGEMLANDVGKKAEMVLLAALSPREHQVLCMIASGKLLKEISEELSCSPKTVSTYRTRLLRKMHMKNNAELIHYAVKNRLV